jgi:hypothetical protein
MFKQNAVDLPVGWLFQKPAPIEIAQFNQDPFSTGDLNRLLEMDPNSQQNEVRLNYHANRGAGETVYILDAGMGSSPVCHPAARLETLEAELLRTLGPMSRPYSAYGILAYRL